MSELNVQKENEEINKDELMYDFNSTCPVCGRKFVTSTLKKYAAKPTKMDADFFVHYDRINPYFYEVRLCPECGYAALKSDFENIKYNDIELFNKNIRPKWSKRKYPGMFDIDIAIERYKIALVDYCVMNTQENKKATFCLKLSWMYRIKGDEQQELFFQQKALEGYNKAYFKEDLPFYGMDKTAVMYLLGELNRRVEKKEEALKWFSRVITERGASSKIKDIAREQKDLVKLQNKKDIQTK